MKVLTISWPGSFFSTPHHYNVFMIGDTPLTAKLLKPSLVDAQTGRLTDTRDMPLIIKVASIPKERIQVYFIDNDEYFKRKATFTDEDGALYPDNDERAIFYAKGVVETVKKLNWVPDIIHVHGWLAGLLPVYMKHYYKDEALFSQTKVVTSVYGHGFEGSLDPAMINKVKFDGIPAESVEPLSKPEYENIIKVAVDHSDAVIIASENVPASLTKYIESSGKPFLPFVPKEKFAEAYTAFYQNLIP